MDESVARPDGAELIGAYDSDPLVVDKWRDQQGGHIFRSVEAVLDSDADAVIVEGRIFQNLDYAELALEAGKHVLFGETRGC